jgi:prepilin-type N-terminal cleavage/methylation domain-containing protein
VILSKKEKQKRFLPAGFTVIEIVLVIAIMSILAVVSIVSWRSFSQATALSNTAKVIETKIKLAKNYSLSAVNDLNYGVHLEAASVTIFPADAAYVLDDPDNQVYVLTDGVEIYDGAGIDIGIGDDIIFSRLTGSTINTGAIGVRMISDTSKIKIITVNSQGQTGTNNFVVSPHSPILEGADSNGNVMNSRHIHFNLSAWSIQNSSSVTDLIFRKADNTIIGTAIATGPFFNAGIFDWQGSIVVDGMAQKLRIHTLDINGTTLCIIRDRMQNNKTIKIDFVDGGVQKEIVAYTEEIGGTVTVSPNYVYVNEPVEAQ